MSGIMSTASLRLFFPCRCIDHCPRSPVPPPGNGRRCVLRPERGVSPFSSPSPSLVERNPLHHTVVSHIGEIHSLPTSSDDVPSDAKQPKPAHDVNEILEKLKRYGVAGVLSYGLFNTFYYLVTFLVVWLYVAPAPTGLGYAASAERFIKIMAMVWAGSQVTKLIRAGGALALAPLVDRGLTWFTNKFKFASKAKAFAAIAALCFGLALVIFVVLTVLWA